MKLIPFFKYQNFSKLYATMFFIVLFNMVYTNVFSQKNKDFVVVLDAGHGGHDSGKNVKGTGYKEKVVALGIVLKTGALLEKIPGFKVLYTRKKDVFVKLKERGNFANKADADLFVSVHCNAHTSQAKGAETWVLGVHANERNFRVAKAENEVILMENNYKEDYKGFDPNNPTSVIGLSLEQEEYLDQSLLLATLIQKKFEKNLKRVNRGVKQAGFVVLYQTYMPSVLIETGFLTNKVEGKFLYSKVGQEQMSKSIAKSIIDYYKVQQVNVADSDFVNNENTNSQISIASEEKKGAFYKIQLASGKSRISTSSYNFKGIKNVERVAVGDFYKYYLGKYNNKEDANSDLSLAKSKGYKSAFIVGFNQEKRVSEKTENITKTIVKPASKVYYKVQIASSAKKISTKKSNFKGLQEVNAVKVGSYFKYYLGKTTNYQRAKEYLSSAKSKKYNSAFIVAFLNNERITLKEALKIQTN